MQESQPPKLDYQMPHPSGRPNQPGQRYRVLWQMLLGLGLGTVTSLIVWVGGWQALMEHGSGTALFVVPGVKIVAGVVFLCIRRWRGLGGGILLSLALGFLIFFGTCAANFKI